MKLIFNFIKFHNHYNTILTAFSAFPPPFIQAELSWCINLLWDFISRQNLCFILWHFFFILLFSQFTSINFLLLIHSPEQIHFHDFSHRSLKRDWHDQHRNKFFLPVSVSQSPIMLVMCLCECVHRTRDSQSAETVGSEILVLIASKLRFFLLIKVGN